MPTPVHSLPPLTTAPPDQEPVSVPPPGRPWSEADLWELADDARRFELVRGELLMMSPASPVQSEYAALLSAALVAFVYPRRLGGVYVSEPGFELQPAPEQVIRAPDVAFVRRERIPPPEQRQGFWKLAPDLAAEIISPSETSEAVQAKVRDYLAAGTRLVWLVYPRQRSVMSYHAGGQFQQHGPHDSLEGGEVLPGFSYALAELFAAEV
jgi:Uma2 family endonuclease